VLLPRDFLTHARETAAGKAADWVCGTFPRWAG
jgi:hypothetical protein